MLPFRLSPRLEQYLATVESETGREVKIEEVQGFSMQGMKASFVPDDSSIRVQILAGMKPNDPEFEQSIAHEATHGLLVYAKGYSEPKLKRPLNPLFNRREIESLKIAASIVDDIAVNRIIQLQGFMPFSPSYLSVVKQETKAAREGTDMYRFNPPDPVLRDRFMIYRYITAWAFDQFFRLTAEQHKTLRRFLKTFQDEYPQQYEMAIPKKALILQNDVSTSAGHRAVVERVLQLWGLSDLVELQGLP